MMKFLQTTFLLLFVSSVSAIAGTKSAPNVILILADDTGYTDIAAFAEHISGTPIEEQFYETPNIDFLSKNGASFSQAYACPLCAPTRSSILTGRYASKIGFTTATPGSVQTFYNQNAPIPEGYMAQDCIYWGDAIDGQQALWNGASLQALPSGGKFDQGRDEVTIAEKLNEKGYRSAMIGKWHLGGHGSVDYCPSDQGFEEIAYFDAGGSQYYNWTEGWNRQEKIHVKMPQDRIFIGNSGGEKRSQYLTDDLTLRAVEFIESQVDENPDQPFFLYFAHFALHAPIQAPDELTEHFEHKETRGWNNHTNAAYAAMIRKLDDSVGSILETLDRLDISDNTIIVFASDNGGVSWPLNQSTRSDDTRATSNTPFKGGKAMVYEGGIRVPLIFYWDGVIRGSEWIERAVDCNDIFPTILELAGADKEDVYEQNGVEIDGCSLLSLMETPCEPTRSYDRDTFYWHYPFNVIVHNPIDGLPLTPHSAIRKGKYKLIYDWSGRIFLYDIDKDLSEKNDLALTHPSLAKELFGELNEWLNTNVEAKYFPTLNPLYQAQLDNRDYPFVDLRKEILGESYAIAPKPDHVPLDVLK